MESLFYIISVVKIHVKCNCLTRLEISKFYQRNKNLFHFLATIQNCQRTMPGEFYLILCLLVFAAYSFAQGTLFWRRDRKKLINVVPKETVPIQKMEDCLGVCLFNEVCKSFNFHHGQCNIFDKDRCMSGVKLADEPDSIYFDLIAEHQCELQTSNSQPRTTPPSKSK